ncbi:MAG: hypothetical protein QM710_14830 [Flavobacterium sp.]
MINSENLQKILPFGYLYLVTMGILKESVFYFQIDINILKYSTIMDILISPIATLTANPVVLIGITVFILICYAFVAFLSKNRSKKIIQKMSSLKNYDGLKEEDINKHYTNLLIAVIAMGTLSFFLGIGLGSGSSLSGKIKKDKLHYDQKLNFNTGETKEIYLIDNNSTYYFYIVKGNKNVQIAPIGAIKNIELIDTK